MNEVKFVSSKYKLKFSVIVDVIRLAKLKIMYKGNKEIIRKPLITNFKYFCIFVINWRYLYFLLKIFM